ncbi:MAG: prepilin-type N-terminal cleavage/methylation domain-containing protein [Candidatus Omnitrophica bacterium]|nr:prepilin-type N-terminal cleavage/methylation domain-containing protein [Candidatus Omnitrophota bacterium]
MRCTKYFFKNRSLTGFTPLEYVPGQESIPTKKNIHDIIIGKKCIFKNRSLMGFTLLEVLLVLIILSIIAITGSRYAVYAIDAQKYVESCHTMVTIRRALIGDERLNNLGTRVDFGFVERYGVFPNPENGDEVPTDGHDAVTPANSGLADFLPPAPQKETIGAANVADSYKQDAWGNDFVYSTTETITLGGTDYDAVEIKCLGRDGAAGGTTTIFYGDFHIIIRQDLYTENLLLMNVMDVNGTILRGYAGANYDHQIYQVDVIDVDGNTILETEGASGYELFYSHGIFANVQGATEYFIPCGFYRIVVYPTTYSSWPGENSAGKIDHRDDLMRGNSSLSQWVPIYPKSPKVPNYIEFRLPGVVDVKEL